MINKNYYSPTELLKKLIKTTKPHIVAEFNRMIMRKGLQHKNGSRWLPTNKGKALSYLEITNIVKGQELTKLYWNDSILKKLSKYDKKKLAAMKRKSN